MSNVLLRNSHALIMQDNLENTEAGKKACHYESITLKHPYPMNGLWYSISVLCLISLGLFKKHLFWKLPNGYCLLRNSTGCNPLLYCQLNIQYFKHTLWSQLLKQTLRTQRIFYTLKYTWKILSRSYNINQIQILNSVFNNYAI